MTDWLYLQLGPDFHVAWWIWGLALVAGALIGIVAARWIRPLYFRMYGPFVVPRWKQKLYNIFNYTPPDENFYQKKK